MNPLLLLSSLCLLAGCASLRPDAGEPAVQIVVTEDDNARVDELRVRGVTQRVVVQSKVEGAKPYDVIPRPGGSDPSKQRDAAGKSVWNVLSF